MHTGAVLVSKEKSAQRYHIYLSDLDLVENSSQKILASFCVGSNIATEQGWRPFFPDTLTLPAFKDGTPKGIQGFRSDELAAVKVNIHQLTNSLTQRHVRSKGCFL